MGYHSEAIIGAMEDGERWAGQAQRRLVQTAARAEAQAEAAAREAMPQPDPARLGELARSLIQRAGHDMAQRDRVVRGLHIAERPGWVWRRGPGIWRVRSTGRNPHVVYRVLLQGRESLCTCPDNAHHPDKACKHIIAAWLVHQAQKGE